MRCSQSMTILPFNLHNCRLQNVSCPLVWMFNDRATNAKLNRTFEKALRLVCKSSELKLEKLKEKYETIHQHNLQLQMVEILKIRNNVNPAFMKSIFTERHAQ